jgi:phosphate transport system permease protein
MDMIALSIAAPVGVLAGTFLAEYANRSKLGATTWEVVWKVVLPYTRVGVVGGVMLGLGRALGETMAVTFVLGNAYTITGSLLMPGTTISSAIANEFNEAVGTHRSALIALGFLLFVVTFVVLLIARLMLRRLSQREGR